MRPLFSGLFLSFLVACGPAAVDPSKESSADSPISAGVDRASPAPALADLDQDYVQEIQTWRDERREGLLRPQGWLTLVGLHWLEEGETSFGSAPDNDFVLSAKAPAHAGRLILSGQQVQLEALDEAVRVGGEPVGLGPGGSAPRMGLAADITGEPTVVEIGSLRFFVIVRGPKVGVRLRDLESEALKEFAGLEYFPIDPKWRIEGRLIPNATPTTVAVPDVLGQVLDQPTPGTLELEIDGAVHRLTPIGEPGEGLFLVFGDSTNGDSTYGAGRFLYTEAPDDNGRVFVDFNYAYNPPCAFTPYATCPLPPAENRLPIAVASGELSYALHP